jgi:cytohesin
VPAPAAAGPPAGTPAEPGDEAEARSIDDLPDAMIHRILDVYREACFDCTGVSRRFRRVCLEAVGALAGQRWALRLAAERGHVAALRALLDGGADLKAELTDDSAAPPRPGGTALHCADRSGRAEAVRLLLAAGSAVDAKTATRDTALHCAAENGHDGVAQLLLDAGAAVDAANTHGATALHCAAYHGHAEVAQLLLGAGSAVDAATADGWTPLFCAAVYGHAEAVQLLLDAGSAVDAADADGVTPLHCAAAQGHATAV